MEEQNLMKSMKPRQIVELVMRQSEEIETLTKEIQRLEEELKDSTLDYDRTGTLAEAAVGWNRLLQSVDEEAKSYRDIIEERMRQLRETEDQLRRETEDTCLAAEAQMREELEQRRTELEAECCEKIRLAQAEAEEK